MTQSVDILILSNGPGELTTWVRPVVQKLHQQLAGTGLNARISVVLSPCPHATEREVTLARSYPEVDRVQGPEHFWSFLLTGKTAENWTWSARGVVLFLGGDQFFTGVMAKRLGYYSVIYGEWETRWWRWIDRFGVMKPETMATVPQKYIHKFTVVGDLIADVRWDQGLEDKIRPDDWTEAENPRELIGLLPGSKSAKLAQGMPLVLAIAHHLQLQRPQTQFVIPVAPTLDLQTLEKFSDPNHNPLLSQMGGITAKLHSGTRPYLQTSAGLNIQLVTQHPAYDVLTQCRLCITTVGANTAELGSLAVPMMVLVPTQQLDAMRAWDGIPGLLANLPVLGSLFAKGINGLVLRQGKRFAWPNIWAGEEIVPELIGKLDPKQVADLVLEYLEHPDRLQTIRNRLCQVRGQPGAAQALTDIVIQCLTV
ncbi:MAG: lipid-A-disaccharide synthase [Microcoleaceae cyanobacterium]